MHPPLPQYSEEDLSQILVSKEQIAQRINSLAAELNEHYGDKKVTIICILSGALIFVADLIRQLKFPTKLDSLRVESYGDQTTSNQTPKISNQLKTDINNAHVLIIDDILDTGNTLYSIINHLKQGSPLSLKSAVLLDKKERRQAHIEADFTGFTIPDEFVVGYGLDFAEHYRNLNSIGILKPEFQQPFDV